MGVDPLDPLLARRLREIGLDPGAFGDAGEAWQRLHARFGRRASLIDRYALEAAQRGCRPDELDVGERARLTNEVLSAHYPGIEIVASAGAASGSTNTSSFATFSGPMPALRPRTGT